MYSSLIIENTTIFLTWNAGNKRAIHAAWIPRTAQVSFIPRHKPEITHQTCRHVHIRSSWSACSYWETAHWGLVRFRTEDIQRVPFAMLVWFCSKCGQERR